MKLIKMMEALWDYYFASVDDLFYKICNAGIY